MKIRTAVVMSALDGCPERAKVVARAGPRTTPKFIEAVSIAMAVRYCSSGTAVFHMGRTERLIGGAVKPRTAAKMMRSLAPWQASNVASATA